ARVHLLRAVLVPHRAPAWGPDRAGDRVRDLRLPGRAHRRHPAVGDPAVGRFGLASDGGPDPRPDHLQPAVLGIDPARGDRRPRRLTRKDLRQPDEGPCRSTATGEANPPSVNPGRPRMTSVERFGATPTRWCR